MTIVYNHYCNKCKVRIPKHRPRLVCSICHELKHLRCQYLSKTDASDIINLDTNWICRDCVTDILPVNACAYNYNNKLGRNQESMPKVKVQCHSCMGFSYSQSNTRMCSWGDHIVHKNATMNH